MAKRQKSYFGAHVATSTDRTTKQATVTIQYYDNVDYTLYTMQELVRYANIVVGQYIAQKCNEAGRNLWINTFATYKRGRLGTRIKKAAFQYWARKIENDLLVGIKHDTWYGVNQELGTKSMPKHGILRDTVYNNIDEIRKIQAQYLSALNDQLKAEMLVKEAEGADDGQ